MSLPKLDRSNLNWSGSHYGDATAGGCTRCTVSACARDRGRSRKQSSSSNSRSSLDHGSNECVARPRKRCQRGARTRVGIELAGGIVVTDRVNRVVQLVSPAAALNHYIPRELSGELVGGEQLGILWVIVCKQLRCLVVDRLGIGCERPKEEQHDKNDRGISQDWQKAAREPQNLRTACTSVILIGTSLFRLRLDPALLSPWKLGESFKELNTTR